MMDNKKDTDQPKFDNNLDKANPVKNFIPITELYNNCKTNKNYKDGIRWTSFCPNPHPIYKTRSNGSGFGNNLIIDLKDHYLTTWNDASCLILAKNHYYYNHHSVITLPPNFTATPLSNESKYDHGYQSYQNEKKSNNHNSNNVCFINFKYWLIPFTIPYFWHHGKNHKKLWNKNFKIKFLIQIEESLKTFQKLSQYIPFDVFITNPIIRTGKHSVTFSKKSPKTNCSLLDNFFTHVCENVQKHHRVKLSLFHNKSYNYKKFKYHRKSSHVGFPLSCKPHNFATNYTFLNRNNNNNCNEGDSNSDYNVQDNSENRSLADDINIPGLESQTNRSLFIPPCSNTESHNTIYYCSEPCLNLYQNYDNLIWSGSYSCPNLECPHIHNDKGTIKDLNINFNPICSPGDVRRNSSPITTSYSIQTWEHQNETTPSDTHAIYPITKLVSSTPLNGNVPTPSLPFSQQKKVIDSNVQKSKTPNVLERLFSRRQKRLKTDTDNYLQSNIAKPITAKHRDDKNPYIPQFITSDINKPRLLELIEELKYGKVRSPLPISKRLSKRYRSSLALFPNSSKDNLQELTPVGISKPHIITTTPQTQAQHINIKLWNTPLGTNTSLATSNSRDVIKNRDIFKELATQSIMKSGKKFTQLQHADKFAKSVKGLDDGKYLTSIEGSPFHHRLSDPISNSSSRPSPQHGTEEILGAGQGLGFKELKPTLPTFKSIQNMQRLTSVGHEPKSPLSAHAKFMKLLMGNIVGGERSFSKDKKSSTSLQKGGTFNDVIIKNNAHQRSVDSITSEAVAPSDEEKYPLLLKTLNKESIAKTSYTGKSPAPSLPITKTMQSKDVDLVSDSTTPFNPLTHSLSAIDWVTTPISSPAIVRSPSKTDFVATDDVFKPNLKKRVKIESPFATTPVAENKRGFNIHNKKNKARTTNALLRSFKHISPFRTQPSLYATTNRWRPWVPKMPNDLEKGIGASVEHLMPTNENESPASQTLEKQPTSGTIKKLNTYSPIIDDDSIELSSRNSHVTSPNFRNARAAARASIATKYSRHENIGYRLHKRKALFQKRVKISDMCLALAITGIILMMFLNEIYFKTLSSKAIMVIIAFKILITLSTLILLIFLVLYYRNEIELFKVENFIEDWCVALTLKRITFLACELAICSIHPFPSWPLVRSIIWQKHKQIAYSYKQDNEHIVTLMHKSTTVTPPILKTSMSSSINDTVSIDQSPSDVILSVLMFCRLYLVVRTLLLHSKMFSDTSSRSIGALNRIKFNTHFIFKTLMTMYPVTVLLTLMISWFLLASWILRTCERQYDPNNANIFNAFWLTSITFLAIGYGDLVPNTYCGRGISVCTGIMGAGCTALVVAVLAKKLELTKAEKHVHNFMMDTQYTKRMKHAAANVLRETWLIYKYTKLTQRVNTHRVRKHQRKFLAAIKNLRRVKTDQRKLLDNQNALVDIAKIQTSIYDIVNESNSNQMNAIKTVETMQTQLNHIYSEILLMKQNSKPIVQ